MPPPSRDGVDPAGDPDGSLEHALRQRWAEQEAAVLETATSGSTTAPRKPLKGISLKIRPREVTAFIGPSGCGKSTLLRCFNRMNDLIPGTRVEGDVLLDGQDVNQDFDPVALRRRVGMVFQKPNPFPKSIRQNITWGARINGYRGDLDELVEGASARPPSGRR
jgi:ABC-type phosphate transport system ATPase subunit